ncbi:Uma2 family endonuclease [Oscillatoria sp. HE19RPO]|uniref:Uma2 family endonuclease n=1 Tax=Oscillatoria sp. HE19RPO TaxID=2954806 RepID=UPI0020C2E22C|nr:Uma2 family endonuclease [Oscillatoria sp. HE19RPO]
MTESLDPYIVPPPFPEHTQLPESDGTFVHNFYAHPQSILLTDSIGPVLERIHPDGEYAIGQDCGIYWRETEPPEQGAEAPDWFYVPNVPPNLDGEIRRSYVYWREYVSPLIALEFASGTGEEERDRTPLNRSTDAPRQKPGKFWVYEKIIKIPYYGIYEIKTGNLEVYNLSNGYDYQKLEPNERGHYPISLLGIELGLWQGSYQNQTQLWLRWWDEEGNLLLTGAERAELAQQREESERQRADRAERSQRESIPRLLGMGLTPEQVAEAMNLTVEQVREMS